MLSIIISVKFKLWATSAVVLFNLLLLDGGIALGSSSLTGNVWDGCLWMFDNWEHYKSIPNLDMYSAPVRSGVTEIKW